MSDLRTASDGLVAACRDFLIAAIRDSKDAGLPPDTDIDEYIDMLVAMPRSVRRRLEGVAATLPPMCKAIRAVEMAKNADPCRRCFGRGHIGVANGQDECPDCQGAGAKP
ncbi:MAG: hypothetical protein ABID63_18415 [Pseudomonadota bacterium]